MKFADSGLVNVLAQAALEGSEAANVLGLSRQAIHKHLDVMTASGELERIGAGRAVRYTRFVWTKTDDTAGLEEAAVWDDLRDTVPAFEHMASIA